MSWFLGPVERRQQSFINPQLGQDLDAALAQKIDEGTIQHHDAKLNRYWGSYRSARLSSAHASDTIEPCLQEEEKRLGGRLGLVCRRTILTFWPSASFTTDEKIPLGAYGYSLGVGCVTALLYTLPDVAARQLSGTPVPCRCSSNRRRSV